MMDNWTIKGPWKVVEHSWEESSVYGPDNKPICTIRIDYEVTEETQDHYEQITAAKARAIAALPDLIKAAEQIIAAHDTRFDGSNLDSTDNDGWSYPVENSLLRALRSALLKAKGEAK